MITSKAARRNNGRHWIVCLGACCVSVLFVNSHAQQPTELIVRNGLIVQHTARAAQYAAIHQNSNGRRRMATPGEADAHTITAI